jgi:hypothetical protein
MNYVDNYNLRADLLLGKPIWVNRLGYVYPPTINEIEEINFTKYYTYVNLIVYKDNYIEKCQQLFDALFFYDDIKNLFIEALSFFLKEKNIKCDTNLKIFFNGDTGCLDKNNFNEFVDCIKQINCLSIEDSIKYANNRAKQIAEKLKKLKEKYLKNKKQEGLDFLDIISSVCAKHPSINLFNVGNLTIYQLIDQFKRLNMVDNFYISVESLLHGAEKESIKIIHWAEQIKN